MCSRLSFLDRDNAEMMLDWNLYLIGQIAAASPEIVMGKPRRIHGEDAGAVMTRSRIGTDGLRVRRAKRTYVPRSLGSAPEGERAEVFSAFNVLLYLGNALPALGVGFGITRLGFYGATVMFGALVSLLTIFTGAISATRLPSTPATEPKS
jgi:hypothetical protein